MEPSVDKQKIQSMKSYERAKIVYNVVLYSLTSVLTCFFFSSPFWFPSITNHFFSFFPSMAMSYCFNTKCFFVVGNLIVFIIVGEICKLKQSSSTLDTYDEYVSISQSSHHKETSGSVETLIVEEKIRHHEEEEKKKKKKKIKNIMPHGGERKTAMRSCKSEVWGEGGMMKMEKNMSKKEEEMKKNEEKKIGMRSCRSEIWSENEIVRLGKTAKEEDEAELNVLNKRVEDFIARINKKRLLEAKLVHHSKG